MREWGGGKLDVAEDKNHTFWQFFLAHFPFSNCLTILLLQCTWQTSLKECHKVRNYSRNNCIFSQRVQETDLALVYLAQQNVEYTEWYCNGLYRRIWSRLSWHRWIHCNISPVDAPLTLGCCSQGSSCTVDFLALLREFLRVNEVRLFPSA